MEPEDIALIDETLYPCPRCGMHMTLFSSRLCKTVNNVLLRLKELKCTYCGAMTDKLMVREDLEG